MIAAVSKIRIHIHQEDVPYLTAEQLDSSSSFLHRYSFGTVLQLWGFDAEV